MTFLSPSLAQNSFIEYVFSDGTKENEFVSIGVIVESLCIG